MGKSITLKYKGIEYTLEFTKATIRRMEDRGFDLNDILDNKKPMTAIPMFFHGAFLAHHNAGDKATKNPVDRKKAEEIYSQLNNRTELLVKLVELYTEPLDDLFGSPEESEGNATWEATF